MKVKLKATPNLEVLAGPRNHIPDLPNMKPKLHIGSVLVICHLNIQLTEAGVMHEVGYVYSIWST